MFRTEYKNKFSAVHRTIARLNKVLEKRRVATLDGGPRLIFLCGANKSDGSLSERRKAIKEFVENNSTDVFLIIAEEFFTSYLDYGGKKNLLDAEHGLSSVADHVTIILEGDSAFCELGAFAHKTLRDKLVVINNSKYKNSKSFINLGPISAVETAADTAAVLWYPMKEDGVTYVDSIGLIAPSYMGLVNARKRKKSTHLDKGDLDPSGEISKIRMFFVHDLIYMAGPMTYKSLIDLVKIIFGDQRYDPVKEAVALLRSLGFVSSDSQSGRIKSSKGKPFLTYEMDLEALRADFSMIRLRNEVRNIAP